MLILGSHDGLLSLELSDYLRTDSSCLTRSLSEGFPSNRINKPRPAKLRRYCVARGDARMARSDLSFL